MIIGRSILKYTGLVLILFVASSPAYAYLDPGTGSLIIQSIIGAIAAAGVTAKLYWHKLKLFFFRGKSEESSEKDTTSAAQNDIESK